MPLVGLALVLLAVVGAVAVSSRSRTKGKGKEKGATTGKGKARPVIEGDVTIVKEAESNGWDTASTLVEHAGDADAMQQFFKTLRDWA